MIILRDFPYYSAIFWGGSNDLHTYDRMIMMILHHFVSGNALFGARCHMRTPDFQDS